MLETAFTSRFENVVRGMQVATGHFGRRNDHQNELIFLSSLTHNAYRP